MLPVPNRIDFIVITEPFLLIKKKSRHTTGISDWLTESMMGEIASDPSRIRDVNEIPDIAAEQSHF